MELSGTARSKLSGHRAELVITSTSSREGVWRKTTGLLSLGADSGACRLNDLSLLWFFAGRGGASTDAIMVWTKVPVFPETFCLAYQGDGSLVNIHADDIAWTLAGPGCM
jgi:hypothetical protein